MDGSQGFHRALKVSIISIWPSQLSRFCILLGLAITDFGKQKTHLWFSACCTGLCNQELAKAMAASRPSLLMFPSAWTSSCRVAMVLLDTCIGCCCCNSYRSLVCCCEHGVKVDSLLAPPTQLSFGLGSSGSSLYVQPVTFQTDCPFQGGKALYISPLVWQV